MFNLYLEKETSRKQFLCLDTKYMYINPNNIRKIYMYQSKQIYIKYVMERRHFVSGRF